jgi:LysR family transcriptional regulator, glycine cleavage system transcriptional activator
MVHDIVAGRRLCRVLSKEWDLPSSKVHVIRWPGVLSNDSRVKTFAHWVAGEAQAMTDLGEHAIDALGACSF